MFPKDWNTMNASRLILLSTALLFTGILALLPGCLSQNAHVPEKAYIEEQQPVDPLIRVRLSRNIHQIQVSGPAVLQVTPEDQHSSPLLLKAPVKFELSRGQWVLTDAEGQSSAMPLSSLTLISDSKHPLSIKDRFYPGQLRLVPKNNSDRQLIGFDIVNHTNIEHYLPGVLAGELFSHWNPSTFRAQAIAARSYALKQVILKDGRSHFDLESSTASQAYVGITENPRAIAAVKDTNGLVLTWENEILTAYYSSTKGDIGQSSNDAFGEVSPEPLRATQHPPYAIDSPRYNWDTIVRDRTTLSKRLAAWGRFANHKIKNLAQIDMIRATGRNEFGRPNRYTVLDRNGMTYTLRGERFRQACNFRGQSHGAPAQLTGKRLPSSWFKPIVDGDQILFTQGRGFGHGVGMCQYGAEGMAKQGHDAIAILTEYYPGAEIEKAY